MHLWQGNWQYYEFLDIDCEIAITVVNAVDPVILNNLNIGMVLIKESFLRVESFTIVLLIFDISILLDNGITLCRIYIIFIPLLFFSHRTSKMSVSLSLSFTSFLLIFSHVALVTGYQTTCKYFPDDWQSITLYRYHSVFIHD